MVHHGISISYQTTVDAAKYCDIKRGSGYCDEAGSFTYWRQCSRYELDSNTIGESDTPLIGYKKWKRAS